MTYPTVTKDGPTPLRRDTFRVVMADTDAAGVIYFGAPIGWAERLVTTWLADAGCATSQMLSEHMGLPAVHCEAAYSASLRLDDAVIASLWVDRQTQKTVTFRSEFRLVDAAEPAVVVRVTQVQAEIGSAGLRSVDLAPKLVDALGMSRTNDQPNTTR